MAQWAEPRRPEIVVGGEARGFLLGAALAYRLGCGFVPARRPGKLPLETVRRTYELEYGSNVLELQADALAGDTRVLVHDDVLATGGTAGAMAELVEEPRGRGGRVHLPARAHLPERPRAYPRLRRLRARRVLTRSVRAGAHNSSMYDPLRTRYVLPCPVRGETAVMLSAFRRLERLPGASHPAVFAITFACPCGDEHPGLVPHDDLDWAPLGLDAGSFVDLMTDRIGEVPPSSGRSPPGAFGAGEWPWSFFCYAEDRPRPVFPSSFTFLAPGRVERGRRARRALSQLREPVDQPRLAGPRRPAVPQRRSGGRRRARLPSRRRASAGRVSGRALLGRVRHAPASALALPRRRSGRRGRSPRPRRRP